MKDVELFHQGVRVNLIESMIMVSTVAASAPAEVIVRKLMMMTVQQSLLVHLGPGAKSLVVGMA